jgi:signal transduction histidine kinase
MTVRARLTLLYISLFAVCGAIVVAVSYILVAQLGTASQAGGASKQGISANFAAHCRAARQNPPPNKAIMAKCDAFLRQQGAQGQRDLTRSHLLQYSLITLAVIIALAALLGWIAAGRALRPVHQITAAARAASEHNLSARVAATGPRDELRELAETFDDMLGRLQAAFEGQQRFIANASHELRTPLAVMRATVDVVLGNPASTTGDLRAMGADIRAAVDHAEQLIGALLILARSDGGLSVHEETDLAAVAEDVLEAASPGDRQVHATLAPAVVSGDPVLAERLVANLVDNAIRYNIPAGDVWITTRAAEGTSQLTVANTGPVIGAADVDRILQPFQRLGGRTSQDGAGLGLAIVVSIARIHGGTVSARPRDGGGLAVTVTLPSPAVGARAAGLRAVGRPDGPRAS